MAVKVYNVHGREIPDVGAPREAYISSRDTTEADLIRKHGAIRAVRPRNSYMYAVEEDPLSPDTRMYNLGKDSLKYAGEVFGWIGGAGAVRTAKEVANTTKAAKVANGVDDAARFAGVSKRNIEHIKNADDLFESMARKLADANAKRQSAVDAAVDARDRAAATREFVDAVTKDVPDAAARWEVLSNYAKAAPELERAVKVADDAVLSAVKQRNSVLDAYKSVGARREKVLRKAGPGSWDNTLEGPLVRALASPRTRHAAKRGALKVATAGWSGLKTAAVKAFTGATVLPHMIPPGYSKTRTALAVGERTVETLGAWLFGIPYARRLLDEDRAEEIKDSVVTAPSNTVDAVNTASVIKSTYRDYGDDPERLGQELDQIRTTPGYSAAMSLARNNMFFEKYGVTYDDYSAAASGISDDALREKYLERLNDFNKLYESLPEEKREQGRW